MATRLRCRPKKSQPQIVGEAAIAGYKPAKGVSSEAGVLSGPLWVVSGEPVNWMNKVR